MSSNWWCKQSQSDLSFIWKVEFSVKNSATYNPGAVDFVFWGSPVSPKMLPVEMPQGKPPDR